MDDLVAFLRERLDEDEAAAKQAHGETWDFTGASCEVRVRPSGMKQVGDFGRVIAYCRHGNPVTEDLSLAIHIAHNDPARVLREVAAKRAILAEHELVSDERPALPGWPTFGCKVCHFKGEMQGTAMLGYCTTLLALGAAYGGHPDYRPEWKP